MGSETTIQSLPQIHRDPSSFGNTNPIIIYDVEYVGVFLGLTGR